MQKGIIQGLREALNNALEQVDKQDAEIRELRTALLDAAIDNDRLRREAREAKRETIMAAQLCVELEQQREQAAAFAKSLGKGDA